MTRSCRARAVVLTAEHVDTAEARVGVDHERSVLGHRTTSSPIPTLADMRRARGEIGVGELEVKSPIPSSYSRSIELEASGRSLRSPMPTRS